MEELRVVIAGGGTGGHFFPGLAVAQALKAESSGASVLFVGAARGVEARLAPQNGFPFHALRASGFAGVGLLKRINAVASLPLSLLSSLRLLLRFKPGAVVGVGGYASLPVAFAAGLAGIPVLLLEQNVKPGLSNRLLSPLSSVVAVAFPQAARHFGSKARLLGNPVRASLEAVGDEFPPPHPLRLLVFGGSRGARAINDAMIAAIPALQTFRGGIEIHHQTGAEDLDRVRAAYAEAGFPAKVEPFIEDMDRAYSWCHAVLCRSGATTLAELCVVGRPALLVPFPHAAGDHQALNARGLADLGGALWVDQSSLTTEALMDRLVRLADPAEREAMAQRLKTLAKPDAAREIASMVKTMAGGAP